MRVCPLSLSLFHSLRVSLCKFCVCVCMYNTIIRMEGIRGVVTKPHFSTISRTQNVHYGEKPHPLSDDNATYSLTTSIVDASGSTIIKHTSQGQIPRGGFRRVMHSMHWPSRPPVAGSIVQMAPCDGSLEQAFVTTSGTIRVRGADGRPLCLDSSAELPHLPPLVLQPCDG